VRRLFFGPIPLASQGLDAGADIAAEMSSRKLFFRQSGPPFPSKWSRPIHIPLA